MANVKDLNQKIASLRNTRKMTRTMKLVAASKLRRAQGAQEKARAYAAGLTHVLESLTGAVAASAHPLLTPRETIRKALVLVVLSDRGLCGGFNNNLIRRVTAWLEEHRGEWPALEMSFCGRRGYSHFRTRETVCRHYQGVTDRPTYAAAVAVADDLMAGFTGGQYDQVYLIFNRFVSPLRQEPVMRKLLPIEHEGQASAAPVEPLFEPSRPELLGRLLPNAVRFSVYNALLENAAGEHAARMTAMESATSNAEELIRHNTLLRNRVRQAAITRELIEIVTGAEAL